MTKYGLRLDGTMIHRRHAKLICGRTYKGTKRTVNKLMTIHLKVCTVCLDSSNTHGNANKENTINYIVHTNESYTNNILSKEIINIDKTRRNQP